MADYLVDITKSTSRFGFKVKCVRFVWTYLIWSLFKYIPGWVGSALRIIALRMFGAKIGRCCLIEVGVRVWLPWRLELSEYVAIGRSVEIYNYDWVRVGAMSVVSQYSYLCTGSHDYGHPYFPLVWRPITLGDQVWVAAGAFVAPGVTIGSGAVVGARAVVTKDLEPWSVNTGNPAKFIKKRTVFRV